MPHYQLHHDPYSSHQQIARLIRKINAGPILDVGSAQGMLGELLQGSGLEIDAVEPNAEWAQAARRFYRHVYCDAIEKACLPLGYYRVVVCADVLEHTVDPHSVLYKLKDHASDDATFIVSLPNVAHLAVRLMLLAGKFPKMDRGILDRTHLHFFTRDTAEQLLRDAGLKIVSVSATPVPLEQLLGQGKIARFLVRLGMMCQRMALAIWPRLFAMQWIFVAKKAG